LLVFVQNPGKLITREALGEVVWENAGEYVSDNTLNVYIKRLREKIEDDPAHPVLIETVRGLGYRAQG
jgi:DNA-binding response OmpR family regulator